MFLHNGKMLWLQRGPKRFHGALMQDKFLLAEFIAVLQFWVASGDVLVATGSAVWMLARVEG